jgi:Flp pilus assembly protein TadG
MMFRSHIPKLPGERGQALLETAIGLPLLLMLVFNLINIGHFWFMVLALAAAPRHAVQFASQGGAASAIVSAPAAIAVRDLVYSNLTNAIHGATTSNVAAQVCVSANGVNPTTYIATCTTYGPSVAFPSPVADPEAPVFVLQRVDVAYTVSPLIPGTLFNVLIPSNLTFRRQVSMRSLY